MNFDSDFDQLTDNKFIDNKFIDKFSMDIMSILHGVIKL